MNYINSFTIFCIGCFLSSFTDTISNKTDTIEIHRDTIVKWETILDGTSFTSYKTLEASWNYLYPWGEDHNGSARMYAGPQNRSQLYIKEPGILVIKASRIYNDEGKSKSPPHLPIHYRSGTIHLKSKLLLNDEFPAWELSGDFKAPTAPGTWPAFWITSTNGWTAESDILEFKGTHTNWSNTYDGKWENTYTTLPDAYSTWHNYKLIITRIVDPTGKPTLDAKCEYFIDGILKGTHTGFRFYNKAYHVIINMQMEGDSGSNGPETDVYYQAKNIIIKRVSLK